MTKKFDASAITVNKATFLSIAADTAKEALAFGQNSKIPVLKAHCELAASVADVNGYPVGWTPDQTLEHILDELTVLRRTADNLYEPYDMFERSLNKKCLDAALATFALLHPKCLPVDAYLFLGSDLIDIQASALFQNVAKEYRRYVLELQISGAPIFGYSEETGSFLTKTSELLLQLLKPIKINEIEVKEDFNRDGDLDALENRPATVAAVEASKTLKQVVVNYNTLIDQLP